MEYIEIDIRLKLVNPYAEIFIARLNEIKYESFSTDKGGLKAYIRSDLFNKKKLTEIVDDISSFTKIDLSINAIKKENWNADWENNYSPVHINKDCVIRAHFHDRFPNIEHEIIITPKMSFGTGHHETTFLVMNQIFELNLEGKHVLDIGSGTGILSILSSKLKFSFVQRLPLMNSRTPSSRDSNTLASTLAILGAITCTEQLSSWLNNGVKTEKIIAKTKVRYFSGVTNETSENLYD